MFQILKLSPDTFRLIDGHTGISSEGSASETREVAEALGATAIEVDSGMSMLEGSNANCADFGIGRTFISAAYVDLAYFCQPGRRAA